MDTIATTDTSLITAAGICKTYRQPDHAGRLVLDHVDFTLKEGEIVAIPDVLLLDEPFSALDVLTAETLRGDIEELWMQRRVPTKGIIFVSHNIEEAVEMADRIIVFGSDPGCIRAEIPVPLPRWRDP